MPLVMEIDDEDDCGRHLQPEDNGRCSLPNHIGGAMTSNGTGPRVLEDDEDSIRNLSVSQQLYAERQSAFRYLCGDNGKNT